MNPAGSRKRLNRRYEPRLVLAFRQDHLNTKIRTRSLQNDRREFRRTVSVGIQNDQDTATIPRTSRCQTDISIQITLPDDPLTTHPNRLQDLRGNKWGYFCANASNQ